MVDEGDVCKTQAWLKHQVIRGGVLLYQTSGHMMALHHQDGVGLAQGRLRNKWDRIKTPKTDPCLCGHLI